MLTKSIFISMFAVASSTSITQNVFDQAVYGSPETAIRSKNVETKAIDNTHPYFEFASSLLDKLQSTYAGLVLGTSSDNFDQNNPWDTIVYCCNVDQVPYCLSSSTIPTTSSALIINSLHLATTVPKPNILLSTYGNARVGIARDGKFISMGKAVFVEMMGQFNSGTNPQQVPANAPNFSAWTFATLG